MHQDWVISQWGWGDVTLELRSRRNTRDEWLNSTFHLFLGNRPGLELDFHPTSHPNTRVIERNTSDHLLFPQCVIQTLAFVCIFYLHKYVDVNFLFITINYIDPEQIIISSEKVNYKVSVPLGGYLILTMSAGIPLHCGHQPGRVNKYYNG